MKRVMMVSPRYLPIIGGAEVQCSRLVKRLKTDYGSDIRVVGMVTRRVERSLSKQEEIDGLAVTRIGPSGLSRFNEYLFCFRVFLFLIFRYARYDVIHCHATGIFGVVCSLAGRIINKKVYLKISTNDELSNLSSSKVKRTIASYTFGKSTFIALNKQAELSVKKYFPNVPYKLIPNGIDESFIEINKNKSNNIRKELELKYGSDVKIGVYVGRYVVRKGIDIINALSQGPFLQERNIVILLVGGNHFQRDGVMLDVSNERIVDVGMQKNVFTYLDSADFFLSPSRLEGLPNTVLEALSCQLPCVLSNIGPHSEIHSLHKNETFLFELEDLDSLNQAISDALLVKHGSVVLNKYYAMSNVSMMYRNLFMEIDHEK